MRTTTATAFAAAVAGAGLAGWYRLRCTGLRRELATVRHTATHDQLTGIPNRTGLLEAWPKLATNVAAVAMLDLDGFKPVNDRHGHATGDVLLAVIAGRLHRIVPGTVARLGGDEFALAIVDHDPSAVARRVAAAVAEPIPLTGGATVTVTASIGLTWYHRSDLAAALAAADSAMYRAKQQPGPAVAVYDPRRDDRPSPATQPRPPFRVRDRHPEGTTPHQPAGVYAAAA